MSFARRRTLVAAAVALLGLASVACGQPQSPRPTKGPEGSGGPTKQTETSGVCSDYGPGATGSPTRSPAPSDGRRSNGPARWRIGPTEDDLAGGIIVEDLDILDADNMWAAGQVDGDDEKSSSWVARWDGSRWVEFHPVPGHEHYPVPQGGVALEVAGPNDIWFVRDTFICRWDGSTWQTAVAPSAHKFDTYPADLQVAGRNDAWAVGHTAGYHQNDGKRAPAIIHWDGRQWSQVESPAFDDVSRLNDTSGFRALAVVSPDDIWAVGSYGGSEVERSGGVVADYGPIAAHWDGATWTRVDLPDLPDTSDLRRVTAVASDEVWAVGQADDQALALRWDGQAWTDVSPSRMFDGRGREFLDGAELTGVASDGAGGMWATAFVSQGEDDATTFFLHWTNGRWQRVDSPAGDTMRLVDIANIPGTTAMWAVGGQQFPGYLSNGVFVRYGSP
jgi:hypothetical protein